MTLEEIAEAEARGDVGALAEEARRCHRIMIAVERGGDGARADVLVERKRCADMVAAYRKNLAYCADPEKELLHVLTAIRSGK